MNLPWKKILWGTKNGSSLASLRKRVYNKVSSHLKGPHIQKSNANNIRSHHLNDLWEKRWKLCPRTRSKI